MYDENHYLSWYIPRVMAHDGSINLHSSGVPPVDFGTLRPPALDAWSVGPAFEAALARWLDVPPDELLYVPGATGGTLHALLSLVAPGEEIVVESPIYEPMLRQAERLAPVRRLMRRPDADWRFDLAEAEQAIGPKTRCILLTEPHNPSGRFAPREDVLALAEIAAARGAYLLVNEVYRGWSDRPSLHGAAPNLLVVSSLSKLLGAYALRLGWISGPSDVLERLRRCVMNTGRPSAPSAAAGLALLADAEPRIADARHRAALGTRVDAWVRETPGVSWTAPDGPGFGWISLPEGVEDHAFVERLHRNHGVLVVPGSLWEAPGGVRLGWLQTDEEALINGLERLGDGLR